MAVTIREGKMIAVRYETVGTPVPDPDYPQMDCGYDDIRTGYAIYPNEDLMADCYDPESVRTMDVLAEQPTLGL